MEHFSQGRITLSRSTGRWIQLAWGPKIIIFFLRLNIIMMNVIQNKKKKQKNWRRMAYSVWSFHDDSGLLLFDLAVKG